MIQKLKASEVFKTLYDAYRSRKYRVIVLQGGSRSGKTYAIMQLLIILALENPIRISAWRLKRSWITPSAYADFKAYLKSINLFNEENLHGTSMTFTFNGTVEFGGLDDDQRLHGFTQDIAWMNEAIEADKSSFDQLEMRTRDVVILDFNPSEEESWIYELVKRDDVLFIHSTQKDNPFLAESIRKKIRSYEPTPINIQQGTADEYKWKVYGLGLPAKREGIIFPDYKLIPEWDSAARDVGYGLDFGFYPDPVSFARVGLLNGKLLIDELIYENELNNIIIEGSTKVSIQQRLMENGISRSNEIIADSAAKASISELRSVGYNVKPVQKYPGSIVDGLELMQRYAPFYVTERSVNLIRELKNYTRKKDFASGRFLKEPIDSFNHTIDLVRYVAQTKLAKRVGTGAKFHTGVDNY